MNADVQAIVKQSKVSLSGKATAAEARSQEFLYDNKTMEDARQNLDGEAKACLRKLQCSYDAVLEAASIIFQQLLDDEKCHSRHEFIDAVAANIPPGDAVQWALYLAVDGWIGSAHLTPCPLEEIEQTVTVDRAYHQLVDVFADGLVKRGKMYERIGEPDDNWQLRRRERGKKGPAVTKDNGEAQEKINLAPHDTNASNKESGSQSTPSANRAHLHTPPALAHDSNILARFGEVVQECGVVGEVRCAKLVYLMATSRVLPEPVSGVVKGLSSSGKSYTTETTLKFFPEDALIVMTAMSERALIYMKEEFSHRTLVIYEANALREQGEKNESNLTAYFVRSLLSEGRIVYPVTVRDKTEGFVTKIITKKGPTNVILTTTAINLHGENETRLLSIPTNDSQEQTKAIMRRLAQGKPQTVDFTPWHGLQWWLAQAEHRVVIPYAADLAEAIPPLAVRLRRDFRSILRLIEAHAVLHQYTRDRDGDGRIVATEVDYLAVRELIADLIADGVGATVSKTIRETVEVVSEKDKGEGVTVKAVREHLKLDRSAAQRRIQAARDKGYLVNLEEKRWRPARYAIQDSLPEDQELLPLSISSPVQHTTPDYNTSVHSVSDEKNSTLADGVQVCTVIEETKGEEVEEVIDLVN